MPLKITSTAFNDGEDLPEKYTCDGEGISPPIQWEGAPAETRSFVLIYDDPDAPAGTWDHWVLYNLPPNINSLPEDIHTLPQGTQVGLNSWPHPEYGAPCPPSGEHHYVFHLYALDTKLNIPNEATSKQIYEEIKGHIIDQATLTALYKRK